MKPKGIILTGPDKTIEAQAAKHKLPVIVDSAMPLAYGKTLFVAPGIRVPWDLLPAGWHFLERWDAAVPLWRYGVNARDVGSKADRKRTEAVIRDLRVLLHSVELLFVANNLDGQTLINAYREEGGMEESALEEGAEIAPLLGDRARLAFLRAVYRVKPRLCVLPTTWLAEVHARSKRDAQTWRGRQRKGVPLSQVEVEPGVFIKCLPGDEEKMLAQFNERRSRRHG